jgi:cell division GTPase FtsZ
MTYLFVGAGQAGGAIVDALFEYTDDSLLGLFSSPDISTLGTPLVFNSTIRDLENLANVPEENQFGIAEQHGLVERSEPGFEEMVTGGFGRDPVRADEVMVQYDTEVQNLLDRRFGATAPPPGEEEGEGEEAATPAPAASDTIDFVFLCLGLGGGTGCGIGPHLARQIKRYTDGHAQVIAVAILPNTKGSVEDDADDDGIAAGRQAWNARYGLDRLEDEADGIVLVDNQRISYLDSSAGQFGEYNAYVAASLYDLITGPVFSSVDASEVEGVDTPDIDVQDIVTSLSFGIGGDSRPGYAAIGRSVSMTQTLPGYLLPFVGKREIDSAALSRLSASKQTLANADSQKAQKAISLVRAPSSYLTDGSHSVETATIQEFLERSCGLSEVNLGIALSDRKLASLTTLLTYRREDLDRIAEIESIAEAYEEDQSEQMMT